MHGEGLVLRHVEIQAPGFQKGDVCRAEGLRERGHPLRPGHGVGDRRTLALMPAPAPVFFLVIALDEDHPVGLGKVAHPAHHPRAFRSFIN